MSLNEPISMLACQRHLFDIPDDVAYLNCAYISPLLNAVRDAGIAGTQRKSHPWEIFPRDFFADAEEARGLFAELIGATANDVALGSAASYGIATAARNLPVQPGQRILVLQDQFPSNVYSWHALANESDGAILTLQRPEDDDWTRSVLEALDERVAIAALPHVHWTDGAMLDLVRIGARCREVGAALVIDGTQSVGVLPFDVNAIQPDFLAVATYKWLLGPYGSGFIYAAPKWQEGTPLEHNWINREGSEDFSNLVDYRDSYQSGARRYDVGERGNIHLVPMVKTGLCQLLDWGVDNIQHTIGARTDRIAVRAADRGITTLPAEHRAGHYLGLRFPAGVPEGLADRLAQGKVYVSVRGRDAVRVTPHLWVTDEDEERFFTVLTSALTQ
jgi:selenocysteine lyase/cysteine desulfurase